MLEKIWDWAFREVRELKRAPIAACALVVLSFVVGWLAAQAFYAERIEVLQLQVGANGDSGFPSFGLAERNMWSIVGVALTVCAVLVISNRNNRGETRALIKQVDALQERLPVASKDSERIAGERDTAITALKDKKHEYAREVLDRYSNARPKDW